MEIMKRLSKIMICMIGAIIILLGFMSCEKSSDEQIIDADSGKFVEVPDPDTWVTDDDIKSDDLDLLVDLSVKVERMRQEFVLMLSNNGEGNKLFCGVGSKTDVGPTIKLFTDMMLKQDEYKAALERLDGTAILKQTSTRGLIKDGYLILTTGQTEAEAEKDKVQEILTKNNVYGNENAQKQLYDFYCSQEPDYAKKIGATDAKDFFNKLNNGELNRYMLNISHIWRDKGILEADKSNSAVGDYAYTAFTGKAEYVNSAYRVSSKVAVAAGEIYFTAIDKVAGGYGAKIMELGDAIEKKITKLKLMKKVLEGKPDWQDINTYVVKSLADDIKTAISEALGDDDNIGTELVNMVTEEICDYIVEQCTVEGESDDSSKEAKEKQDEEAKAADLAILNIETDFSSQGKMILVTDESTGKINVATPTYDGHVSLATTPGNKIVTVIKNNGERLTKRITVVAGTNTLIIKSEQKPYIDLNPSSITLEDDAGSETAVILTNCKYIKLRQSTKEDWCDVQLEINGSAGRGFHVRVNAKANLDSKERSGSFILEGYAEAKEDSKPVVTKTFRFTQEPYSPVLTPIDVNPTSLTFDAKGGQQIVTLDLKNYKYCGVTFDEKYDSWLTATANSDATITVKVAANDTGVERTATIYAYGTDLTNPQSLDEVAFKAIPVTQSGGGGSALEFVKVDFSYNLNSCTGTFTADGESSSKTDWPLLGFTYDDNAEYTIERKESGSNIIFDVVIKSHHEGDDGYGGTEKLKVTDHIVFDVEASNPSDITTYKIVDISFDQDWNLENVGSYWGKMRRTAEFVNLNIPFLIKSGSKCIFEIKGKDIRPEHVKQVTDEDEGAYYDGSYQSKSYFTFKSSLPNEYNFVKVELYLKE